MRRADGAVALETISTQDMRSGAITPGMLSTVRVQYVAVGADTLVPPSQQPTQTPDKVIDGVRGRDDVARLDKIMGGLAYEASYVASQQRWLVTAKDAEERVVRQVVVPDQKRIAADARDERPGSSSPDDPRGAAREGAG